MGVPQKTRRVFLKERPTGVVNSSTFVRPIPYIHPSLILHALADWDWDTGGRDD